MLKNELAKTMFNPDRLNLSLYFKSLTIDALFVFWFNSNFKALIDPKDNVSKTYTSLFIDIIHIFNHGVLGFWGFGVLGVIEILVGLRGFRGFRGFIGFRGLRSFRGLRGLRGSQGFNGI